MSLYKLSQQTKPQGTELIISRGITSMPETAAMGQLSFSTLQNVNNEQLEKAE